MEKNNTTLTDPKRTNYIKCYNTDDREWNEEISITMHAYAEDLNEIYWWQFSSTRGLFDLTINNKKLLFGKENRTPSTPNDLINAMGTDNEEEKSISSKDTVNYIYNDYDGDKLDYEFRIDTDDNQLKAFMLSR